jgi:hypothetical protein
MPWRLGWPDPRLTMSTSFESDTPRAADDFDDEVTGSVSRSEQPPPSSKSPGKSDHEWYVALDGAQFGPFGTDELRGKLAAGSFPPHATVWRSGLEEWEEWGWIPDLRAPTIAPPPSARKEGPSTLSPVESTSDEPIPVRRVVSPWYGVVAAAFVGLGVSFVAMRFMSADENPEVVQVGASSSPMATRGGPKPGAQPSGTSTVTVELSAKGALGPDKVVSLLGDGPRQVGEECWKLGRDSREGNAPPTVSLEVNLEVDATGHVISARSLGDPPGNPGLGTCIAGRTRGWRFPTGSGASAVSLAYRFRKD